MITSNALASQNSHCFLTTTTHYCTTQKHPSCSTSSVKNTNTSRAAIQAKNFTLHNAQFLTGSRLSKSSRKRVSETVSTLAFEEIEENNVGFLSGNVHYLEERNEEVLSKRVLELSRMNKCRSALELFRSMELSGFRTSLRACNSLLSSLFRNKLFDDGMRVFDSMKTRRIVSAHSYSLVLKGLSDAEGCDAALRLFERFRSENAENVFDAVVYNTMISVCARGNNWVEALRIWECLKSRRDATEVTYCLLVSVFVRCGQYELAIDTYGEMVRGGFEPGEDMMQAVIGACSKEGKWELAIEVFRRMIGSGLTPNLVACNAVINSLGKAGKMELAFRMVDVMKSLGHTPDSHTWNALLGALYRLDRYDDALELFDDLKRGHCDKLNSHHYNTALMCCSKLGFWEKALQLLWELEGCGLSASTTSYNLALGACEMARKPEVALQVYEHMIHRNCTPDTFTYLSLIRCCIWGSLWDEVEDILAQIPPDISVYNTVIQGMCLQGNIESAKKLYWKMRKSGLKADGKTRALMLQKLPK